MIESESDNENLYHLNKTKIRSEENYDEKIIILTNSFDAGAYTCCLWWR